MERTQTFWAPLFCKVCQRRASVVIGNVLMCGECFFKHAVRELSESQPDELALREVGAVHAQS